MSNLFVASKAVQYTYALQQASKTDIGLEIVSAVISSAALGFVFWLALTILLENIVSRELKKDFRICAITLAVADFILQFMPDVILVLGALAECAFIVLVTKNIYKASIGRSFGVLGLTFAMSLVVTVLCAVLFE